MAFFGLFADTVVEALESEDIEPNLDLCHRENIGEECPTIHILDQNDIECPCYVNGKDACPDMDFNMGQRDIISGIQEENGNSLSGVQVHEIMVDEYPDDVDKELPDDSNTGFWSFFR